MGNFRFPVKTKLPPGFLNARIIRDNFKRQQAAENEITVRALKYIARNTALPAKTRLQAQLQLNIMPRYMMMTQVKNRCIASGTARAVIGQFGLGRTQFREKALAGELPGVKKGVW